MAFPDFDSKTFKKSVLGAGAGAVALMLVSTANAGNNDICLPLEQLNGQTLTSGASAAGHSEKNFGTVAISAYPGPDMRNSPENLTKFFRKNNIAADCFINNSMFPNSGTAISIYVNGHAVSHNGKKVFGIQQLRDNPEILKTARAEATAGRAAAALTASIQQAPTHAAN